MGISPSSLTCLLHVISSQKDLSSPKIALELGKQDSGIVKSILITIVNCLSNSKDVKQPEWILSKIQDLPENTILSFSDILAIWNFKLESLDVSDYEGANIIANLDKAKSSEYLKHSSKYDLVIDGGTFEHCFNIPNAATFINSLTKIGGIIFHFNPSNRMVDHGFYQICPTLYYDLYSQGRFDLVYCGLSIAPEVNSPKEIIRINPYNFDLYRTLGKNGVNKLSQFALVFAARKQERSFIPETILQSYYQFMHDPRNKNCSNRYSFEIDSQIILKGSYYRAVKVLAKRLITFIRKKGIF